MEVQIRPVFENRTDFETSRTMRIPFIWSHVFELSGSLQELMSQATKDLQGLTKTCIIVEQFSNSSFPRQVRSTQI